MGRLLDADNYTDLTTMLAGTTAGSHDVEERSKFRPNINGEDVTIEQISR